MNDKQARSPEQMQAKLKNLQQAAGHQETDADNRGDVEITVASQRDAFDLKACRALLEEHGISSKFAGRGFNQVVVVSRDESSRAIDLIAAHREQLLRANPLNAGDYVVGVIAWSLGCGLGIPVVGAGLLLRSGASQEVMMVASALLLAGSLPLGGFLGYLRCRSIASRRRK